MTREGLFLYHLYWPLAIESWRIGTCEQKKNRSGVARPGTAPPEGGMCTGVVECSEPKTRSRIEARRTLFATVLLCRWSCFFPIASHRRFFKEPYSPSRSFGERCRSSILPFPFVECGLVVLTEARIAEPVGPHSR